MQIHQRQVRNLFFLTHLRLQVPTVLCYIQQNLPAKLTYRINQRFVKQAMIIDDGYSSRHTIRGLNFPGQPITVLK
ncbi:hypothetical protein [Spirosoma sp. KNUC1025]|uniref:hypothetical protein n=1 Tax=Spirosoma sp. KNUC1025 TaxID=2894082 RepID=UPI00386661EC|nr:hypothetical protein LN737_17315 [Spirosoma sp. KNUC1025]